MITRPESRLFRLVGALAGLLIAVLSACTSERDAPAAERGAGGAQVSKQTTGASLTWHVRPVMTGLDHPWDAEFLPSGAMLVTERDIKRILLRTPNGKVRVIADDPPGIWAEGETGLMSMAIDPNSPRTVASTPARATTPTPTPVMTYA